MNTHKIIKTLDKIIEYAFLFLIAAVAFSTAFTELSIAIIIASWVMKKVMLKDFSLPKHLFLGVFIIFILWNALSFFNSDYLNESIRGLAKVIKYGLLLVITIDTFKTEKMLKRAVYFLIIWSSVIALNGIIQSKLGFDLIRLRAIDTLDYLARISSSFHQSNNFGAYLVCIIPIYLAFITCKSINWRNRIYFMPGLALLLFCLVKTYSRGAWLASVIAILIFSLLKSRRLFITFIILFVISASFLPFQMKDRITNIFNFKEGTSWERLKLWSGALGMIKKHPLLGFGVNTYTRNFPAYKPADYPDVIYPHNSYLQMATEIGLIGLVLFVAFLFFGLAYAINSYKKAKDARMHSAIIGLFAGEIGFLIHSGVDTHLYSVNLTVMFYFLLGLSIALSNYARTNPS